MRRATTHSSAITATGTAGGALLAFGAAVLAARALPSDEFAAFAVGLALHSLGTVLADVGLGVVTVAETAGEWTSERTEVRRAKLRALFRHRVLSAIAIACALALAMLAIPAVEDYRGAAVVGALGAAVATLPAFAVAVLQSGQRFRAAAVVMMALGALRLAAVLVAALASDSSVAYIAGYAVVAPLVAGAFGGMLLASGLPLRAKLAVSGAATLDRQLRWAMLATFVLAAFVFNVDVLLLVVLADASDVAVYGAAWRVAAGLFLLETAVSAALLPSVMLSRDPWKEAKRLLRIGVAIMAAALVATPAIAAGGLFVLGEAGDGAGRPLTLLLIAFAVHGFIQVTYLIFLRVRRPWIAATVPATQLVLVVTVTLLTIDAGPSAPAYGHLAAAGVGALIIAALLALARLGVCDWFAEPLPAAAGASAGSDRYDRQAQSMPSPSSNISAETS